MGAWAQLAAIRLHPGKVCLQKGTSLLACLHLLALTALNM